MDRKKELKQQYKEMKPDMGVFAVTSSFANKCFIEAARDLKSRINSTEFKLKMGSHFNKELQREWQENDRSSFKIEVLEMLEYDEDETKTDYSDELELLQIMWEEKMQQKGIKLYKK